MLTYPQIDAVAFSLGPLAVRWYGIMYLLGFLLAFWYCLAHRDRANPPWSKELIADLVFYAALGVIFGGSLGYWLLYEPDKLWSDPLILFKFWLPGRSFHGGLIGVVIALWIFAHIHHRRFLEITDFIAPAVPLGLGLGRIGNFLNAELWGRITTVPWGMMFPNAGPLPRHPSQLYEFLLEGVLLFLILFLYTRKPRPIGTVSGLFALCYGIFRFVVEFFREPDQGFLVWDGLSMGQILSLPMILIGIVLLWCAPLCTTERKTQRKATR